MNRFYGEVGYAVTAETAPGVFRPTLVKRYYYGDILKTRSSWKTTEHVNDDIEVSNRISIIADPYAIENFPFIKYVKWLGTAWSVNSIEVEYPRLILSLGGVYNGEQD